MLERSTMEQLIAASEADTLDNKQALYTEADMMVAHDWGYGAGYIKGWIAKSRESDANT